MTIREITLLLTRCPRVQTRNGEVAFAYPVHSLSVLENFKTLFLGLAAPLESLQQSRTVPAIVRRNYKNLRLYATRADRSERDLHARPMVEEMEIFFM